MKHENSSSPKVIHHEKAAQILVDIEQIKVILPFMGQERSISEVARELNLAIDAMTYRVKRFVKLEILEEVRKEARKGRAITYYKAATAFFVPVKAIPNQTTEELFEQADSLMRKEIARSMTEALYNAVPFQEWGVLVTRNPSGNPQLGLTPPSADWNFGKLLEPDAPALLSSWMPLKLEFEDAKALQAELFTLIGKQYSGHL
jgi:DNA-binding MarR family transcriptional regulator